MPDSDWIESPEELQAFLDSKILVVEVTGVRRHKTYTCVNVHTPLLQVKVGDKWRPVNQLTCEVFLTKEGWRPLFRCNDETKELKKEGN